MLRILEINKLLDPYQCGFREVRSMTNHLVRIEVYIRDAFPRRQFFLDLFPFLTEKVLYLFLDMETAYDITWDFEILRGLSEIRIRVDILNLI